MTGYVHIPLEDRFWKYVDKDGPNGCWVWTGYTNECGYGIIGIRHMPTRAHRLVFKLLGLTEPRPDQLVCHHCDNPPCVNPEHLFFGTHGDNNRDSMAKGRRPPRHVTECIHGHPFNDENTYYRIGARGGRSCRACQRLSERRRRDAAKSKGAAS